MASLRFVSFPSTTHLHTPLFSLLPKSQVPFHNLSLSHSRSLTRTIHNPFALSFSVTAQEQAADSSAEVPRKVSRTRVVIQNIPWDATTEDVRSHAEQHGTVLDVELCMHNKTNNRGIAFVSFTTAEEALAALTNLKEINGRAVVLNYAYYRVGKSNGLDKPHVQVTYHLYASNLQFEAKSKELKEFFKAEYDSVHSAGVMYKNNPRQPAGYGFVSFKSKDQAEDALIAFEGKMFMGRPLRLRRSDHYVREEKRESAPDDSSAEVGES